MIRPMNQCVRLNATLFSFVDDPARTNLLHEPGFILIQGMTRARCGVEADDLKQWACTPFSFASAWKLDHPFDSAQGGTKGGHKRREEEHNSR